MKIPYQKLGSYGQIRVRDYGDFSEALDSEYKKQGFCEITRADWFEMLRYNDPDQIEEKIWDDFTEERQQEIFQKMKQEMENQLKGMMNL